MPEMKAKLLTFLPGSVRGSSFADNVMTVARSVVCIAASKSRSAFHSSRPEAAAFAGRRNQFDSFSGNDPRAPLVNRRAAAYFQYAVQLRDLGTHEDCCLRACRLMPSALRLLPAVALCA